MVTVNIELTVCVSNIETVKPFLYIDSKHEQYSEQRCL